MGSSSTGVPIQQAAVTPAVTISRETLINAALFSSRYTVTHPNVCAWDHPNHYRPGSGAVCGAALTTILSNTGEESDRLNSGN